MLGFLVFLLLAQPAEASFPLSLQGARARWISAELLAYRPNPWLNLFQAKVEALQAENGRRLSLSVERQVGDEGILRAHWTKEEARAWVREPIVLTTSDWSGNELDRTYFQLGPLLDDLYHYEGCLGFCGGNLRVWAPTARSVAVVSRGLRTAMKDVGEGVWEGPAQSPYRFEVEVFTPVSGRTEKHLVTDPYSLALNLNAETVVVDPSDPALMPEGWGTSRPAFRSRADAVLYELHVREFSSADLSVPAAQRGRYRAFTLASAGTRHLRQLAEAGITHVHLLPLSDFASVDEDAAARRDPQIPPGLPTDSPVPQEEISRLRALDSFNWGYDPVHYFAPDGSYSAQPDGPSRVKEFREMVLALHRLGLRVVMDMVYNHTFASGLSRESVLDKIVPGYYYRLDRDGLVHNSSCCSDTASERWMMEKLMRDSLESWRKHFHVDGFRFDLMNFHSVSTMGRIRDELWARDPSLLLYGEAWAFGSLYDQAPEEAYTQGNAFGHGIGVFNDRLRDAVRGGTTDSREKSDQGFVTGLFYDFNHEPANRNTPVDLSAQREKLLHLGDVIRLSMAGNLRDFSFRDHRGEWVSGGSLFFRGSAAGFAAAPPETINYVSAHDGYTLFDALQAKLPFLRADGSSVSAAEKMGRQILALAIVAFSQGVPFFDGGSEILRSKSGDQNSYDSGDWFNALDWSYATNGWGRGLPPLHSNNGDWPFWRPRLASESFAVGRPEMMSAKQSFLALLRIRRSSPLFRLNTAAEVQARVRFLETDLGPMQPPGVVVMEISDGRGAQDLDPRWSRLLVALNVTNESVAFRHERLRGLSLQNLFGAASLRPSRDFSLEIPPLSVSVMGAAE